MMVISKMLKIPIFVYTATDEAKTKCALALLLHPCYCTHATVPMLLHPCYCTSYVSLGYK
jgi:hypothetical protein